jgi:hypothetical protein
MRVIQQTSPTLNNMTLSNQTFTSSLPPPIEPDDHDESSGNYNNNNNNLSGGQSLTRSEITVDPGPPPLPINSAEKMKKNESESSNVTYTPSFNEDKDRDESGNSKPLSSSLIAEILLKSKTKVALNDNFLDKMMQDDDSGSETSFKAESPSIFTEQIISGSDIDESDRVGTSIVLQ